MQKTRLGISVGLLGAAIYFMGLFSGYLLAVLLAGYVLLFEENSWLRKNAVKAMSVMAVFSLSNLISAAVAALNIIEKLLIIGLGVKALTQGTIAVPVVDNLINKYMG